MAVYRENWAETSRSKTVCVQEFTDYSIQWKEVAWKSQLSRFEPVGFGALEELRHLQETKSDKCEGKWPDAS